MIFQTDSERIEALLADDTDASVTYAALEARLALEKVCYDRLRQRHDYISHDQLKRWQPGAVVLTLMNEVDAHIGQTMTLKMGKAVQESDGFGFEQVTVPVDCDQCGKANHLPWRFFLDMKHDELGSFSCHTCKHKNFVQWRLMQVRRDVSVGVSKTNRVADGLFSSPTRVINLGEHCPTRSFTTSMRRTIRRPAVSH